MSWPRDRFGVSGTELITDPAQARPCLWRRRDHVYGVGALTEAQLGVGADAVAVHLDVERRVGFEPDPVEVVVAVEMAGLGGRWVSSRVARGCCAGPRWRWRRTGPGRCRTRFRGWCGSTGAEVGPGLVLLTKPNLTPSMGSRPGTCAVKCAGLVALAKNEVTVVQKSEWGRCFAGVPFAFHFADDDGVHTHAGVEQEPAVGGWARPMERYCPVSRSPMCWRVATRGSASTPKVRGEDVGAATGDDAELRPWAGGELGGAPEHAVDGFVDGSVATVDEDGIVTLGDGAGAEFAGVSAVRRVFHVDLESRLQVWTSASRPAAVVAVAKG